MKELTDLTPALTPTAQTALRAIKTLRQYDLPTSAEAERSVLQSLSVEDCTAVILALSAPESKSESLSPSERVSQILDWLVRSAQTELQGMQTPFALKIMFLGVMTERTVTNFKQFRSASANSTSLL